MKWTALPPRLCGAAFAFSLGLGQAPALAQVEVLISPTSPGLPSKYFGAGIFPILDVDGDGVTDFIVAAPGDHEPGTPRGRVYIYSGVTRQIIRTFLPPVPVVQGYGPVSPLGDVDGDGRGDLVIGSPEEAPPPGGEIYGRVRIFSGATGDLLLEVADHGPGFLCGMRLVHGLPDLDGDGRPDISIGYDYVGCYYTRFHRSSDGAVLYEVPTYGEDASVVEDVGQMPDFDGDGIPELALYMAGRIRIVSGATGDQIRTIYSPLSPNGLYISSVAVIDDADGDGVPDIVAGSGEWRINAGAPPQSGVAFLFSGATGELIHTIPPPVPRHSAYFGSSVAALPDMDGDRRGDFVVAAWNDSPPGLPQQCGAAYIFSGGTGQLLRVLHSPNAEFFGRYGASVGRFPEWRPSRRATIPIGAPYEWGSRGRVYLYAACKADADANGVVNQQDISRFITGWLTTVGTPPGTLPPAGVHHGDYNGDDLVNSQDIAAFITDWIAAVQSDGCP